MAIPYPESSDYVADGATAMENIATQVDDKSGLVFVKSQAVGSSVSSVTVTDAFSATFKNYKVIYSGFTMSAFTGLLFSMGSGINGSQWFGVTTGRSYISGVTDTNVSNGGAIAIATGSGVVNRVGTEIFVTRPYVSGRTGMSAISTGERGHFTTAMHDGNNSYTDFTLSTASGTITGGTIRVYGYNDGA